ncbi:MAG: helix-turn-helix domain-containing protein [Rhodobacterales bacterium]|nr:helix-turn-helix domain-containing protein [Rhodobacterales bacterium]
MSVVYKGAGNSVSQAAKHLGIGRSTAYKIIKTQRHS